MLWQILQEKSWNLLAGELKTVIHTEMHRVTQVTEEMVKVPDSGGRYCVRATGHPEISQQQLGSISQPQRRSWLMLTQRAWWSLSYSRGSCCWVSCMAHRHGLCRCWTNIQSALFSILWLLPHNSYHRGRGGHDEGLKGQPHKHCSGQILHLYRGLPISSHMGEGHYGGQHVCIGTQSTHTRSLV